jgi:hypothetical protein
VLLATNKARGMAAARERLPPRSPRMLVGARTPHRFRLYVLKLYHQRLSYQTLAKNLSAESINKET